MPRLAALAGVCLAAATGVVALNFGIDRAAATGFARLVGSGVSVQSASLAGDGRLRLGHLVYHHDGLLIRVGQLIVGDASPTTIPAGVAATGTASAQDVVIDTAFATYRIKRIDVAGTSLSNGDLAAILDATSPSSLAERLAKLSAASITIPEVVVDVKLARTVEHFVYRDIKFENVADGRVATASAAGAVFSAQDRAIDDAEGAYGAMTATGLDIGLAARIATEARTTAAEPKRPLYDTFAIDGIKVSSKNARADIAIGRIFGSGAKGRPLTTPLAEAAKIMDGDKSLTPAEQKTRRLRFLRDVLGSIEVGKIEAQDLRLHVMPKGKPVAVSLAHVSLAQSEARKIAEIGFDGFVVDSDAVKIKLGSFALHGLDLAQVRSSLSEGMGVGTDTAGGLAPAVAELVAADIDADVATRGDGGDPIDRPRVVFHTDKFEMLGASKVAGVPSRFAAHLVHFTMPLPQPGGAMQQLKDLGYSTLDLSSRLALAWDEPKKQLALTSWSIDGAGMGTVTLSALLANVTKDVFSPDPVVKQAAALAMLFKSADLRVVNTGLVEKAISAEANNEGKSTDEMRKDYVAAAAVGVPKALGNGATAKAIGAALAKFAAHPRSLHFTASAPDGLGASDLDLLKDPNDLLNKLDVRATANE